VAQDYRENVKLALDTLRAHPLRSSLTVIGVVIGVGVIVIVAALLTGFGRSVESEITGYGADTAFIAKFSGNFRIGRLSREERMRKELTLEDAEAIQEWAPSVKGVATSLFPSDADHRVRYRDLEVVGLDYRGTFPAFAQVYGNAVVKQGRFFTEAENIRRVKVVVIGEDIAETFFPDGSGVGREILIDGSAYEVIGVFEKPKGGFGDSDQDKRVTIPFYSMRKTYPQGENIGIRIQAYPGQLDRAVDETRDILRRRRGVKYNDPDNFSIQTSQQIVEQFEGIVGTIALALVVLSSIGLLVGGVGVMNIMLVSVTERTREIGVRKAIGARRRDIAWQFLFEAMTLTAMGGVIGIVFFGGLAMLIPLFTSFSTVVPLWAVVAGLTVATSIGLIFGVWPAIKAARLDPVEALRYE